MINLQALLQGHADKDMRALDEFARGPTVKLFEFANEMGLVGISGGGDILPVSQFLPSQPVGRMQSAEFAVQQLWRAAKIFFAQSLDLALGTAHFGNHHGQLVRFGRSDPGSDLIQKIFINAPGRIDHIGE